MPGKERGRCAMCGPNCQAPANVRGPIALTTHCWVCNAYVCKRCSKHRVVLYPHRMRIRMCDPCWQKKKEEL